MYDDLILRLRDAAKMSDALHVLLPHSEGNATAKLYREAADAIEELKILGDEAAISGMMGELDRLTVQTVEQQQLIERLMKTNERLRSKIRSMKSDASWDEDIRRGQVQGMW